MLKTFEVLMVEKSYGIVRVVAKTEEEAHHRAILSSDAEWNNPKNVEIVAVREV
jgi:hypothetical protein